MRFCDESSGLSDWIASLDRISRGLNTHNWSPCCTYCSASSVSYVFWCVATYSDLPPATWDGIAKVFILRMTLSECSKTNLTFRTHNYDTRQNCVFVLDGIDDQNNDETFFSICPLRTIKTKTKISPASHTLMNFTIFRSVINSAWCISY